MENINVTLGLSEDAIEKLVEQVTDNMDLGDEVRAIIDDYDFSDLDLSDNVDSYLTYNVDFKSYVTDELENIDISQYIDADNIDVEGAARNLLDSYSPINGCGTGQAFTEAIEKAVRYLLLKNEDFVDNIANALEKRIEKQKKDEMKASIIEEMKPLLFDEFKADLERYAAQLQFEQARQILHPQTTITSNPGVVNQTTTTWTNP